MKLRVRYSEEGKIRFLSHRDVARIMERGFKKLDLPVAYSQGFSPRPKFSFGLALSVAHESDAEYLDVDLEKPVEIENLPSLLTANLPDGLVVTAVAQLEPGSESLQQAMACCRWSIEVLGAPLSDVVAAVSEVLESDELMLERSRKGKLAVVDVRPAILELEVTGPTDDGVQLLVMLANAGTSLRPSELVQVVSENLSEGRVRRLAQFTMVDGKRCEPLVVPDPSGLHAPTIDEPLPDGVSRRFDDSFVEHAS